MACSLTHGVHVMSFFLEPCLRSFLSLPFSLAPSPVGLGCSLSPSLLSMCLTHYLFAYETLIRLTWEIIALRVQ